ncbi:MAG TPA: DUF1549 and DUF1553 domain-containing protein [Planctomycetota bacterium]|nr:DUF1549 and DUF1553 domain-containing protein [Planctomycetota bacterium]
MRRGYRLLVASLCAATVWAQEPARPVKLGSQSDSLDRLIELRLGKAGSVPSPVADDSEFLRRVTLDLTGLIPTYEETLDFLGSHEPEKRRRRIDELLERETYGKHFATIWHELIAPPDTSRAKGGSDPFAPWLARQFTLNRPWNEVVYELLTAEGKIRENPQSGFILANSLNFDPQPELLADSTARLFWGLQLRCAECHDHPFAPWTQTDFWGIAAFFSRLRKGSTDGKNPNGYTFTEAAPDDPISQKFWKSPAPQDVPGPAIVVSGMARKAAGTVVRGRFLGQDGPAWSDEGPFRERFARWATSPEHPFFVRNAVNRMWAHFFGRGLVHPLDSQAPGVLGSHPEILDFMSKEFRDSAQDQKHLIRMICNSRTYQRTSRRGPKEDKDPSLLGRMPVKRLRPEAFYDSLSLVLYPPLRKPGKGGSPALALPGPIPGVAREEFVAFFALQEARDAGSVVNQGIPQFLRLMNAPLLNRETPGLSRFQTQGGSPAQVVESLFLAAYSRRPTAEEAREMETYVAETGQKEKGYAGLLWAILNSSEFALNH